MRLPLISGQGNFGSMDGDPPAAMRYTEARLASAAETLLADIDKDTVEFQPNYDEREQRADGPAGGLSQSAGQRRGRHRRRHGDQHPAAQSRRADRCLLRPDRQSRAHRAAAHGIRARAGLPDRRVHPRPQRHPCRLRARPRLADHAGQDPDRGGARRPRIDHRLRDPLSGKQGAPARAHRRSGARQAGRRHRRGARRKRSRRRAAGDRAQARRHGRRRAEPALSLHAAADHVRHQRAGAGRRSPAADEPQGIPRGVHPLPRRGHHTAHQVRAQSCPRPCPCAGRARHRRRQYRRGDRVDPPRARPGGGARAPDGARTGPLSTWRR